MIIKTAPGLKDPNRDSNMKHTTPNEIMNETRKRKERLYKVSTRKAFMRYAEGQFEEIFNHEKKINDK